MNTYDPATFIRYVHLGGAVDRAPAVVRLPVGYADESPRTSLRDRGRAVRSRRCAPMTTTGPARRLLEQAR